MRRRLLPILLLLAAPALAQSTAPSTQPAPIDNPLYAFWARQPLQSSISFTESRSFNGDERPGPGLAMRLLKIQNDAVLIEMTLGEPQKHGTLTIPAKVRPDEELLFFVDPRVLKELAVTHAAQAPDKITIDSKPFDATCYELNLDLSGVKGPTPFSYSFKLWLAPTSPTGIAKFQWTLGSPPRIATFTATSLLQPATQPSP